MTNITVEKIDKIITKIKGIENSSKSLSDKEARKLLRDINKDLAEIEKSVEKKQKEIVDPKVKEFREEINKSLTESLGWGDIKTFLIDDVKDDLEELKKEIIKWGIIEQKPGENVIFRDIENEELIRVKSELGKTQEELSETKKELEELRNVSKKSIGISSETLEKVYQDNQEKVNTLQNKVQEKESKIKELEQQLEAKDREIFALKNTGKKSFGESVAREAHNYIKDGAGAGAEIGAKVLPVLGTAGGGLIGAGIAGVGAVIHAGVDSADRFAEHGKEVYSETLGVGTDFAKKTGTDLKELTEKGLDMADKTREGAKEFTENIVKTGADTVENFREGAENLVGKGLDNAKGLFEKGLDTFDITGKLTKGIGHAEEVKAQERTKIEEAKARARAEEIVDLKKRVEELKQEKEDQVKELKEELRKKDEEKEKQVKEVKAEKEKQIEKLEAQVEKKEAQITKLETKIETLERKLEESQKQFLAQVEVNRGPSSIPPYGNQ